MKQGKEKIFCVSVQSGKKCYFITKDQLTSLRVKDGLIGVRTGTSLSDSLEEGGD